MNSAPGKNGLIHNVNDSNSSIIGLKMPKGLQSIKTNHRLKRNTHVRGQYLGDGHWWYSLRN